ncbi:DUF2974 domain-containing protein [Bacillus timonensis]|nr:DUF2974 domain-containing protein [Bacillus timonensis]
MSVTVTEFDHMILSYLVYFDIDGSLIDKKPLTIGDLASYYCDKLLGEDKEDVLRQKFRTEQEFESFKNTILNLTDPSSKYYNWQIANAENNNMSTGFVGYTFVPSPGQAVFAFRGSEAMDNPRHRDTDWYNNATTIFSPLAVQQKEAIEYMNKYGQKYNEISVTGHSLGGNIALAGTVGANEEIRNKIVGTFTFNAPGFNQQFIQNNWEVIQQMKSRIKEFQNENDIVSSILYNLTTPIILKSTATKVEGVSLLGDPGNIDNHQLAFLKADNGVLVRSDEERKNFSCLVVQNMIETIEILPDPILEGIVNVAFAAISGRIDFTGLAMAGIFLSIVAPTFVLAAIGLVVAAVVAVGIIYFAYTMLEIVFEEAQKFIVNLYHGVVDAFNHALDHIAKVGIAIGETLANFSKGIFENVSNVFKGIADFFNNLTQGPNKGYYTGPLKVDLYTLMEMTRKLQHVQNQLVDVDHKIKRLYDMVDLWKKIQVFILDFQIGYNGDLQRCIEYLKLADTNIKKCERSLLQKANQ